MVFGIICSCCGEKLERENEEDADASLFTCQPCEAKPARATPPDMTIHTIPSDTPVVTLEASKAFAGLTPKEQAYALHLSKADWEGAKICLVRRACLDPAIVRSSLC